MSHIIELTGEFENLIAFVREATENAGNSNIDIVALGKKAADLCGVVEENTNPAIAQQIRPLMAQLIQELDTLAMTLEKQKQDSE